MFPILYRLRGFLIACGVVWLIWTISLLVWGYEDSFLLYNSWRASWADFLMPHYTHFGDGLLISVFVGFFFVRKDLALVFSLIAGMCIIAAWVYLSKHYLFDSWDRPVVVFAHRIDFFEIPVKRYFHHAFPSGHSAAVGGATVFLAYYFRKRFLIGLLIGLFSISAAYSRAYIGVHFLGDVLVGHAFAVFTSILTLFWLYPILDRYFVQQSSRTRSYLYRGFAILNWVLFLASLTWIYISEYQ